MRALAGRCGISPTTVQKSRKRASVSDARMGPKAIHSTVLFGKGGSELLYLIPSLLGEYAIDRSKGSILIDLTIFADLPFFQGFFQLHQITPVPPGEQFVHQVYLAQCCSGNSDVLLAAICGAR